MHKHVLPHSHMHACMCAQYIHGALCLHAGTAQFVLGKKLDVLCNFENLPHETAKFIKVNQDILDSTAELIFQPPLYKIYSTKAWKKLLASFSAAGQYCAPVSLICLHTRTSAAYNFMPVKFTL